MTSLLLISLIISLLEVLIKTVQLKSAPSPWKWGLKGLKKIFSNRIAIRLEREDWYKEKYWQLCTENINKSEKCVKTYLQCWLSLVN